MKKKVLFICSYNSVRSQMAEGLLKTIYPERYEVYSAGTQATGVNPDAITVMKEIGIDISGQYSKSISEFANEKFDYVVSVCDNARGACPNFLGNAEYIHRSFTDPARTTGSKEDIIESFRKIRDELKKWIEEAFRYDKGKTDCKN